MDSTRPVWPQLNRIHFRQHVLLQVEYIDSNKTIVLHHPVACNIYSSNPLLHHWKLLLLFKPRHNLALLLAYSCCDITKPTEQSPFQRSVYVSMPLRICMWTCHTEHIGFNAKLSRSVSLEVEERAQISLTALISYTNWFPAVKNRVSFT